MKIVQKSIAKFLALAMFATLIPASTALAQTDFRENFEDSVYTVDNDINGVNGWTSAPANVFKTQWDPDDSVESETNKVLLGSGKQIYNGAIKHFEEPVTNIGYDNNMVEVSLRMYLFQNSGGAGFEIKSGNESIIEVGKAGGGKRGSVFFYPDPNFVDENGKRPGWNEGNLDPVTSYIILKDFLGQDMWYYFRFHIDFNTKKITSYVADFEITDEMIETTIAEGDDAVPGLMVVRDMDFWSEQRDTINSIDNIRLDLSGWGDSRAAWDDIFVGLSGERIDVTNIEVSSPSDTISEDLGTLQMSAAVTPENASNTDVTWSVENFIDGTNGRATISPTGLLTAIENGTVRVRATARDGSGVYGEKDITITGQNENRQIVITSSTGSFDIDEQMGKIQLTATIPDPNFDGVPIEWSINNLSGKAAITSDGLVRAIKNGTVLVTARAQNEDMTLEGTATINISHQLSWLDTPVFTETFPTREEVFGQTRTGGTEGQAGGTFETVPDANPRWTASGAAWATVNNQLARHSSGGELHVASNAGLLPSVLRINQAFKITADIDWRYIWVADDRAVSTFSFNGYSLKARVTGGSEMTLTLTGGGINETLTNQPLGRFIYTFTVEDDGFVTVTRSSTGGDDVVTLFETFAPTPIVYGSSANDINISATWIGATFRDINVYYKDMSSQIEVEVSGDSKYSVNGNTVDVTVPLDRADDRSGDVFGSVVVITAVYGADNRMIGISADTLDASLFDESAYEYKRSIDVTDGSAVAKVRTSVVRSLTERAPLIPAVDLDRI
jgi:hypothetical protein